MTAGSGTYPINTSPRLSPAPASTKLSPMPELLAALDAFFQEHRRCGELAGGVDGERVWMACYFGADIVHPVEPPEPACLDR